MLRCTHFYMSAMQTLKPENLGLRALDVTLDSEESDGMSANWKQHLAQQRRRNWVFDIDEVDESNRRFGRPSSGNLQYAPSELESGLYSKANVEVDDIFHMMVSAYTSPVYAYGLFDTVDIIQSLLVTGLLPKNGASCVETWMISPLSAFRRRGLLPAIIGEERWHAISSMLTWQLQEYDATISPLRRVCSRYGMQDEWSHMLRGCVSTGILSHELAPLVPDLIEGLIKGTSKKYSLPGEFRDRAHTMSHLLLETAVEFGSDTLLDMSLDVMKQHHLDTGYEVMLRVQQCFSKVSKRRIDWQLRSSGRILDILPGWLNKYYPRTVGWEVVPNPPDGASLTSDASSRNSVSNSNAFPSVGDKLFNLPSAMTSKDNVPWSAEELEDLKRVTVEEIQLAQTGKGSTSEGLNTSKQLTIHEVPMLKSRSTTGPLCTDSWSPASYFSTSPERLGQVGRALDSARQRHCEVMQEVSHHGIQWYSDQVAMGDEQFRVQDKLAAHRREGSSVLSAVLRKRAQEELKRGPISQ